MLTGTRVEDQSKHTMYYNIIQTDIMKILTKLIFIVIET